MPARKKECTVCVSNSCEACRGRAAARRYAQSAKGKAIRKAWFLANEHKVEVSKQKWLEANAEKHLTSVGNWRKRNPEKVVEASRRSIGIKDPELCPQVLEYQKGKCAIKGCDREPVCADHDHETGFLRGMLCFKCNNGLSAFRDSPAFLTAALEYLQDPPAQVIRNERSSC